MVDTLSRKKKIFIVAGIIVAIHLIIFFPVIRFNDSRIPLLAFERLVSGDLYMARVLGNHVLQTEHGEIELRNFSRVLIDANTITRIDVSNFENGRTAHNLVVEAKRIPQNVSMSINESTGADLNRDGKNSLKHIRSRSGNQIVFDDSEQ